ncbi:hypothetical protein DRO91_02815 [Candidatus Heimdallarchaeota archaeon]|nr:MAG: hypothetical protein DRP02_02750 [Candidatus Gerdarchaeota archaeon]RLI73477.1 MAG: hypothetical protein DRO91_02815 [Candidatus Heimdallarchaeota archaeon]
MVFRKENENPTALKSKIKGKEKTKRKKRTEEQTFSGNDLLKYSKKHSYYLERRSAMNLITITTKNRTLRTTIEEQCQYPRQIIRRYWLKMTENKIKPLLLVDNGDGTSYSIALEGEVYLKLGEKFCERCGKRIPRESYEAVCIECYNKEAYKARRCIFEGPGEPYGKKCSKENPPCGNRENIIRCYGEHLVYIGRFGTIIKVGITSRKRSEGKYYRLIEQGLDEAIIMKGVATLKEALKIEATISEKFGIRTAIRFGEKVDEITKMPPEEKKKRKLDWHNWAEKLLALWPEKKITFLDLKGLWKDWEGKITPKKVFTPLELTGEVMLVKGNVLILKSKNEETKNKEKYYAINLSRLKGFELISEEELLWSIVESKERT